MTPEAKKRKPRIIPPRNAHEALADEEASLAEKLDYNFFQTTGDERSKILKQKIKERETMLFNLQLSEITLDGNPNFQRDHIDEAKRMNPDGTTRPCNCGDCELERVRDSIKGVIYGLHRLRAFDKKL